MKCHRAIDSTDELVTLARSGTVGRIVVRGTLDAVPSLRLSPGQILAGEDDGAALIFTEGTDGLQLTSDNAVSNLRLQTSPERCAIFNDTTVANFGRLALNQLSAKGRIHIVARDEVRGGHVEVAGLDIEAADARGCQERPKGYGVEVITGAFTLWNQQPDPSVTITADLTGIAAGRAGAPVRGSGIFAAGSANGGRLAIRRLQTEAVYSEGGIAAGTPDRISGGVFVVSGATANLVHNCGPVTTYGPNDMVLDNWGSVDRWIAEAAITSFGPSGIGFVNFGIVNLLQINAPIETFGQGARGFNVYTGTVNAAEFERIVTHADGAVGIQISQPVGEIKVRRGIETFGGTGDSLVKGVVIKLSAIPLSIKPGGSARRLEIANGLVAHGESVVPMELLGVIDAFHVSGGLSGALPGPE